MQAHACPHNMHAIQMKENKKAWEEVKTSILTAVWKQLIPALMGDLEGPKLREKRAVHVVRVARELGLEMERWLSGRPLA